MNPDIRKALVLVTGGILVGGGLGYILAQHRLKARYWEIANEEIESVKDRYRQRYKEGPYSDPTSTAAHLIPTTEHAGEQEVYENVISTLEYSEDEKPRQPPVFTALKGEIRPKQKKPPRPRPYEVVHIEDMVMPEPHPTEPYLISVEEFMEDFENHDKISISYYDGDDTLADEREQMIPDVEGTVGKENLVRFGQASRDPNTVYVRNKRLNTDFEVYREDGSFSVMVLGMDEEFLDPKDDQKHRNQKLRDDRDSG